MSQTKYAKYLEKLGGKGGNRDELLIAIKEGVKLKKTETNDRSISIAGKIIICPKKTASKSAPIGKSESELTKDINRPINPNLSEKNAKYLSKLGGRGGGNREELLKTIKEGIKLNKVTIDDRSIASAGRVIPRQNSTTKRNKTASKKIESLCTKDSDEDRPKIPITPNLSEKNAEYLAKLGRKGGGNREELLKTIKEGIKLNKVTTDDRSIASAGRVIPRQNSTTKRNKTASKKIESLCTKDSDEDRPKRPITPNLSEKNAEYLVKLGRKGGGNREELLKTIREGIKLSKVTTDDRSIASAGRVIPRQNSTRQQKKQKTSSEKSVDSVESKSEKSIITNFTPKNVEYISKLGGKEGGNREEMLLSLKEGTNLKKTVTNDRSEAKAGKVVVIGKKSDNLKRDDSLEEGKRSSDKRSKKSREEITGKKTGRKPPLCQLRNEKSTDRKTRRPNVDQLRRSFDQSVDDEGQSVTEEENLNEKPSKSTDEQSWIVSSNRRKSIEMVCRTASGNFHEAIRRKRENFDGQKTSSKKSIERKQSPISREKIDSEKRMRKLRGVFEKGTKENSSKIQEKDEILRPIIKDEVGNEEIKREIPVREESSILKKGSRTNFENIPIESMPKNFKFNINLKDGNVPIQLVKR